MKAIFTVSTFDPFLRSFVVLFVEATAIPWTGVSLDVPSQDQKNHTRFVAFEDLKLRKHSERLLFPGFFVIAKYCM